MNKDLMIKSEDIPEYIMNKYNIMSYPMEMTLTLFMGIDDEVLSEDLMFFSAHYMSPSKVGEFRKDILRKALDNFDCESIITVHFSAVYATQTIDTKSLNRLNVFNKELNEISEKINLPVSNSLVMTPNGFQSLKDF